MKEQERGGKGVKIGSKVGALPISCMGLGLRDPLDATKLSIRASAQISPSTHLGQLCST